MLPKTPWVTVMTEARMQDLLKALKVMPPKLLDEQLLYDLHKETTRLLRHQAPGVYD